jgi:hypothetical protein
LRANPRIAQYFNDPQFNNMWQACQKNPQMLMQLIQSDPRFMDVFKELTGVDLMDMQEQQMKNKDTQEAQAKKRQADEAAKKAEEERLRKEAEEQALPDEERQVI